MLQTSCRHIFPMFLSLYDLYYVFFVLPALKTRHLNSVMYYIMTIDIFYFILVYLFYFVFFFVCILLLTLSFHYLPDIVKKKKWTTDRINRSGFTVYGCNPQVEQRVPKNAEECRSMPKQNAKDRLRTCAVRGSGSSLVKMAAPIDLELKKVIRVFKMCYLVSPVGHVLSLAAVN